MVDRGATWCKLRSSMAYQTDNQKPADPFRKPENRLKNWTGTVHWARDGKPVCGHLATHSSYLTPSVATVNCKRCIALNGGDVPGYEDAPVVQEHVARRAAERAARRAARQEGEQHV